MKTKYAYVYSGLLKNCIDKYNYVYSAKYTYTYIKRDTYIYETTVSLEPESRRILMMTRKGNQFCMTILMIISIIFAEEVNCFSLEHAKSNCFNLGF